MSRAAHDTSFIVFRTATGRIDAIRRRHHDPRDLQRLPSGAAWKNVAAADKREAILVGTDLFTAERAERGKAAEASKLATALMLTTQRHLDGFMARQTWTNHMRALWGQVDSHGLRKEVLALVDPLARKGAR